MDNAPEGEQLKNNPGSFIQSLFLTVWRLMSQNSASKSSVSVETSLKTVLLSL